MGDEQGPENQETVLGPTEHTDMPGDEGATADGKSPGTPLRPELNFGDPPFQMQIDPDKKLVFGSKKLAKKGKKTASAKVFLTNSTEERQVFKVKCTSNSMFHIHPSVGFCDVDETVTLQLSFKANEVPDDDRHYFSFYHLKCKNKEVTPRMAWKDAKPDGVHRLRIYFEPSTPPPRPDPVSMQKDSSDAVQPLAPKAVSPSKDEPSKPRSEIAAPKDGSSNRRSEVAKKKKKKTTTLKKDKASKRKSEIAHDELSAPIVDEASEQGAVKSAQKKVEEKHGKKTQERRHEEKPKPAPKNDDLCEEELDIDVPLGDAKLSKQEVPVAPKITSQDGPVSPGREESQAKLGSPLEEMPTAKSPGVVSPAPVESNQEAPPPPQPLVKPFRFPPLPPRPFRFPPLPPPRPFPEQQPQPAAPRFKFPPLPPKPFQFPPLPPPRDQLQVPPSSAPVVLSDRPAPPPFRFPPLPPPSQPNPAFRFPQRLSMQQSPPGNPVGSPTTK